MKKLINFAGIFVLTALLASCASTGKAEATELAKEQIEQALGKTVDWQEDVSIGKVKNVYADSYVLYKNAGTAFVMKRWEEMHNDLNSNNSSMIGAVNMPNNLDFKDISELKNGDIFVMRTISNRDYVFQIKLRTYNEGALQVKGNSLSLPSGTIRHIERYAGWGYSAANGDFEDVKGHQGIAGLPFGDGKATLYPWVYADANRFGLMIINRTNKLTAEYELLLLGSIKK